LPASGGLRIIPPTFPSMPTTINGIGTHYYGHKNADKRTGTCRSCGSHVMLESYDTRLWFVVVYIPIIPLGRKRIIDQCPVCKRHYVADADHWETQKQLNVSGALERFHSDPTPEHAIEAHQQFLNFQQLADAAELRREMAEKFGQNAKVQAYLGSALNGMGQVGEARAYFQRAFELRPDLPEARVGLAYDHMRSGRLDEARQMLDFLEKPGAVQLYSLESVESLADAYARVGKRTEALELYRVLLDALPRIGEISTFRAKVKKCEKLQGARESILPKLKFSWKRIFGKGTKGRQGARSPILTWRGLAIFGTIAGVAAIIALVRNDYVRRHRPLYIVNAYKQPATVEVQGVGSVKVVGRAERLELKEGHYHATITGPVKQEIDFDVKTSYGERWSKDDAVWLLNIGGAAVVLEEEVVYRQNSPPPSKLTLHYGRQFEQIDRVTHPFTPLPETVQMKSGESRTLIGLEQFKGATSDAIAHLQSIGRGGEAVNLAEWRLLSHPEDEDSLYSYVAMAEPKRVEKFLHAGLSRRPVQLPWHRAYQNLHEAAAWFGWLTVEYDGMLKADPHNASLLYLRGRVAKDPAEAESWFNKAREADPQNPYPHYALAHQHSSRGDWAGARPLFARAVELRPAQREIAGSFFICRLALQEYAELEKELREQLKHDARNVILAEALIDVLAAQNRKTEANDVVTAFLRAVAGMGQANVASFATELRRHLFYSTGDFEGLAREVREDRSQSGKNTLFAALLEQGKMAEAVRIHPLDEAKVADPFHFFVVSMGWTAAGDAAKAKEWFRRGVDLLAGGSAEDARAAEMLNGKIEPTREQLDTLTQAPKAKAILLATLGLLRPEQRAELFAAARVLNVDRDYPYQIVRRTTAESH